MFNNFWLFSIGFLLCMTQSVNAQDYPNRPIRMIIPFAAGGPTDVTGRILGISLSKQLGQQFVIVNKGGASGSIGSIEAATATPDGHTVMYTASSFALAPLLNTKLGYDPISDYQPISLTVTQPMMVVVSNKTPATSVMEFINYAKANQDKLTYGTTGSGGITHLVVAEFAKRFDLRMIHVPYKGSGIVLTDLAGGQLNMSISTFSTALPFVQAGRMRALAIASPKRHSLFPELPTLTEAVGQEYKEISTWHGMLVPKATPKPIVTRLHKEVTIAMNDPSIRKTFISQGSEPVGSTPEQFTSRLKDEMARWGQVVRDLGLKPLD
jgi:tripartite-type tricarboxylate transporter receptor subunit TctC